MATGCALSSAAVTSRFLTDRRTNPRLLGASALNYIDMGQAGLNLVQPDIDNPLGIEVDSFNSYAQALHGYDDDEPGYPGYWALDMTNFTEVHTTDMDSTDMVWINDHTVESYETDALLPDATIIEACSDRADAWPSLPSIRWRTGS